jgi:predicted lipoprotein with Yx(FWY)xxD motif
MGRSVRGRGARTGAIVVAGMLLFAACGGKGTTTATGGGGGGSTSTGSSINSSTVSGLGTVIADGQGFTLYHLKTEVNGKIVCTGSCTGVWPPLLVSSSSAVPTDGSGVTGRIATITRPDGGVQVTYDGLPVYTYSGDTSPGQANGQGIQGVWFAVTPSGALASSGSGSSSPTAGGYGY